MSSPLLDAQQITSHHGSRSVLDGVDLRVDAGSQIWLVGPNGAGKSTLLRILAACEVPDGGMVRRFGMVGYLPQFAEAQDRHKTVRQTVFERVGLTAASCALDRWASELATGNLDALEPHAAALETWVGAGRRRHRRAPEHGRRGAGADRRVLGSSTRRVVEVRGNWSLGPLEFVLAPGERVLISGPNGSGKSTPLAALAGQMDPAPGRRRVAASAVVGQLGQIRDALTERRSRTRCAG